MLPFNPICALRRSQRLFYKLHTLSESYLPKRNYAKRNFLKIHERGLLQDVFPDIEPPLPKIMQSDQSFYSGFDPTAESLHVGNLLVIMSLIHCQRCEHHPIAVIGNATAQIGDPSGHSDDRTILDQNQINQNSELIAESLHRIFDNHKKYFWKETKKQKTLPPLKVLFNQDWYKDVNIVEFIATYGQKLRLGSMLSRKSVESRLNGEKGMSFSEFSYQLFQAYDWLYLFREHFCKFQIGGSDQMGNIHSGHELISKLTKENVYGLTVPLVKSETGDKLGKSANNAIWLNEKNTSNFEFYQFFLRLSDSDAEDLFPKFTFYPMNEVQLIIDNHRKAPEKRSLQKKLASDVTLLVHGMEGLEMAKLATTALYVERPESLAGLDPEDFKKIFKGTAYTELLLEPGLTVLEVCIKAGCFASEADARRIITGGGMRMNHLKTTSPDHVIMHGPHILPNNITLIRIGKKHYYIVHWLS